jgi:sec-independent protein translocase protein TatA
MFPGGIGSFEMVLLGIVAVILFGGRLPEVARSLGQTYGQFRKGLDELKSNFDQEMDMELKKDLSAITHELEEDLDDHTEEPLPDTPQFSPPSDD